MSIKRWAIPAVMAAVLAAGATLLVVGWAQGRYLREFALRMARTTMAYIAAVTPPPPPPPPPPRARRRASPPSRRPVPPPAAPPPLSSVARSYHLPALLTQARSLKTLPGWTSDVEVYYGTAPLVDATAPPLTTDDLQDLGKTGGRWHNGIALVPLRDRDGHEVVGAVAVRPLSVPRGPLPGGFGLAFPAAVLAIAAAAVIAFRDRPLRRGGYIAAAFLLAGAAFFDVYGAARNSTNRWLTDSRRLIQEAAARMPAPGSRANISDLAALVQDSEGELVAGEPGESAPRRVRIEGIPRAVAAVLIGSNRWVELRSDPAERTTLPWIALLLPSALLGPLGILLLRWAERTSVRSRRATAIAWGFLTPAFLHLVIFTIGPALVTVYLAFHAGGGSQRVALLNVRAVLDDPLTLQVFRNTLGYALYVPISVLLALGAALVVHAHETRWAGRLLRTALVSPYLCSIVATALLWQLIYRTGSLGLGRPDWLSNAGTALPALMLMSVWAHVGGQMMVFLAALQRVPRSYLDAARVDGAGAWRRFWRITLPLIRPFMWFVLVTGFISAFQVFTLVTVLTQGGPANSTDVLVHRILETAMGQRQAVGVASALALILLVLVTIFRWPQLKLLAKALRHA